MPTQEKKLRETHRDETGPHIPWRRRFSWPTRKRNPAATVPIKAERAQKRKNKIYAVGGAIREIISQTKNRTMTGGQH